MPNALIHESSLYLRQHANNPVDWYPWSAEVFSKAQQENKPLIISIGYSSCHWCHVMEKECFEDKEVAEIMNKNFICVKVDREEYPDLDNWYMLSVQLLGRPGGWPLNVFALPDGSPFFGGTYFPKAQWIQLLQRISALYKSQPFTLTEQARRLKNAINEADALSLRHKVSFETEDTKEGWDVEKYLNIADEEHGGELKAPKFPMPGKYLMWMKYAEALKHDKLKEHIFKTLHYMAGRGLYDHLQGGFFRYSTDREWILPHFEKMLYDNVQLLELYAMASVYYKNDFFRHVAIQTAEFLFNDMMDEKGYFYSSIDADSEGQEGKYYLWTSDEIQNFITHYSDFDISSFRDTLWIPVTEHESFVLVYPFLSLNPADTVPDVWKRTVKRLREFRKRYKVPPVTDKKMILSWNAMAVRALANAGYLLDKKEWISVSEKVMQFLENNLKKSQQWYRIYENNMAKVEANSADIIFLSDAFRVLFEVTGKWNYIEKATELMEFAIERFQDESLFFLNYEKNKQKIYGNLHETEDNVIPSVNSVAARNLYALGFITGNASLTIMAEKMYGSMHARVLQYPEAYYGWLELHPDYAGKIIHCVFVGNFVDEIKNQWLERIPLNAKLLYCKDIPSKGIFEGKNTIHGKNTLYVCKGKICHPPVSWEEFVSGSVDVFSL